MLRYLPLILWLGLLVFSLIDLAQARDARGLPRRVWALLIVLLPLLGAVGWLTLGRPHRRVHPTRSGARATAPDDDPEFLDALARRIARGRRKAEGDSPA